jgi:hypothetical protein
MPWSPTQSFPHPLANIQSSNADVNMTNFISYALVEMMTWQGLGDVINRFRERALGLDPISLIWAPGVLSRLRIPYTYCWCVIILPLCLISGTFKSLIFLLGRQLLSLNPKIGVSTYLFLDSTSCRSLPPTIQTQNLQPSWLKDLLRSILASVRLL